MLVAALLALLAGCGRVPPTTETVPRTACEAELRALGATFEPWPAPAGGACRVERPIRLVASRVPPDRPLETNCALARAWLGFEPELLAVARRELGAEALALLHMGSWSCRRMTGNAGRTSQHARALALDVAGFRLADGRRITVAEHWRDRGPAGRFLRAAAKAACRHFPMVLTPDSDRWHRDHLHLDLGPFARCDA